ncbi:MAG: sensor histidine kinase, partial [Verrucomicrobium sp.]
ANQRVESRDVFRWVEGEGPVSFLASDGRSLVIEFGTELGRLQARVDRWEGAVPRYQPNLRVKFRGVCEVGFGVNNQFLPGRIWVPTQEQVSFVEGVQGQGPVAPLPPPAPATPSLEGFYFTRGVVSFSDRVLGRDCLFVQEALGGVFVSIGDRKLGPTPQVGQSVEIGGGLIPGRHAPVLVPMAINQRGWQTLPSPAPLFQESGPPVYREGQWSEAVGVVRAVNPDGTLILACKGGQIRVWIGRTEPAELAGMVDSVIRVRGVMSLGVFEAPVLLSPSRTHVELMDPAPEQTAAATTVATGLARRPDSGGWTHRVSLEGWVTLRFDGGFYLQDETGGACVRSLGVIMPPLGVRVLVSGYPDGSASMPRLTEAIWQEVPNSTAATGVVPALVGAENPPLRLNASLVTVTARLLSQKRRGTARVLELQTDGHVLEAVLEPGGERGLAMETGSTLKVTGVALLKPLSDAPSTQESAGSLVRLLLRCQEDVLLVQGPPWWTWKRAVVLVSTLLVVIVGTLLRISFLNRRFIRQQQARLTFARELLESQESERRRIAASLHDSLGQNLLVIRNQVHMALQGDVDKPAVRQRLEAISDTTLQALEEVREITHNLRPYHLDRLGLTQSIRATVRKVSENCPVVFACHVDEVDGLFDKDSEIHIYRIVQEGVNNIVKHSGATEATVVVKLVPGHVSISIRDNGSGLPAGRPASEGGFGLTGVKERAEIMGGSTRIDSSAGQGFALHVELPSPPASKCATP